MRQSHKRGWQSKLRWRIMSEYLTWWNWCIIPLLHQVDDNNRFHSISAACGHPAAVFLEANFIKEWKLGLWLRRRHSLEHELRRHYWVRASMVLSQMKTICARLRLTANDWASSVNHWNLLAKSQPTCLAYMHSPSGFRCSPGSHCRNQVPMA